MSTAARLFDVTVETLGRKRTDEFPRSTICLGKDGTLLVMDAAGHAVRFQATRCRVEQIAAHVIVVTGVTDKPRYVTAYCMYANEGSDKV